MGWAAAPAAADYTTAGYTTLRTGWDDNEPGLVPSQVSTADFGQLFAAAVDGQVYAQPVIAGGVVVAATDNNKVYGLDPVTGAQKWLRNLGPAWPVSTVNCGDLTPTIGVTSTPVYDRQTSAPRRIRGWWRRSARTAGSTCSTPTTSAAPGRARPVATRSSA